MGSDWGLVASTDFKSDGSGLILGTVGSIPTHFRQTVGIANCCPDAVASSNT